MKKKWIVLAGVAAFILVAAFTLAVTATDRWWPGGTGTLGANGPNAALYREYLALQEEHMRILFPPYGPPPPQPSPEKRAALENKKRAKAEKVVQGWMERYGIREREALERMIRKDRRTVDELRADVAAKETVRKHEQEKHSDDLDPYGQKKRRSIPDRPDTRPRPYW